MPWERKSADTNYSNPCEGVRKAGHKSLRQGRSQRTPAMAIGLTDHVWSYREYIELPVHPDPTLAKQMDERIARLLTPALHAYLDDSTQVKTSPEEVSRAKAASLPKAA